MKQIITVSQSVKLAESLKKSGQKIVLVGGCFDILHLGHVKFLEKAKIKGDILFILLESDQTIKRVKGENRPINSQAERAKMLISLKVVDFVVLLPEMKDNLSYDELIKKLHPDILAGTAGDPGLIHLKRQSNLVGAEFVEVVKRIPEKSTTEIINKK